MEQKTAEAVLLWVAVSNGLQEGVVLSETEYSLGKNCCMTFAGIKPASLITVRKNGRNDLERLARCFCRRGFCFEILRENTDRLVVYVYHEQRLRSVLFSEEIYDFLYGLGYRYMDVGEAVERLRERMQGDLFPHEVGVFLGYPLSDVKGFIADPQGGRPGYWKVYGNEEQALKIFSRYRKCSDCICRMMDGGKSLTAIFRVE